MRIVWLDIGGSSTSSHASRREVCAIVRPSSRTWRSTTAGRGQPISRSWWPPGSARPAPTLDMCPTQGRPDLGQSTPRVLADEPHTRVPEMEAFLKCNFKNLASSSSDDDIIIIVAFHSKILKWKGVCVVARQGHRRLRECAACSTAHEHGKDVSARCAPHLRMRFTPSRAQTHKLA